MTQQVELDAPTPPAPTIPPETSQFDFWLGEWDCEWGDGQRGSNTITRTLDGFVVLENFDAAPADKLRGMSVSTYDTNAGKWKQTWVDNTGSYLAFSGGFADGKMILTMPTQRAGKEITLRMVWQNITDEAFDWSWERSEDGENWQVMWAIRYMRKSA